MLNMIILEVTSNHHGNLQQVIQRSGPTRGGMWVKHREVHIDVLQMSVPKVVRQSCNQATCRYVESFMKGKAGLTFLLVAKHV